MTDSKTDPMTAPEPGPFADIRNRVGSNAAGLFVLAGEATPARRRHSTRSASSA